MLLLLLLLYVDNLQITVIPYTHTIHTYNPHTRSWYLLVAFFGVATIISAIGIHATRSTSPSIRARLAKPAGILQSVMVGMWHMNMTTVLLVDVVTWTVLRPMYNRDPDPAKVWLLVCDVFILYMYKVLL